MPWRSPKGIDKLMLFVTDTDVELKIQIEEVVSAGPEREPRGRILVDGCQEAVYRCELERQALLREIEAEQQSFAE